MKNEKLLTLPEAIQAIMHGEEVELVECAHVAIIGKIYNQKNVANMNLGTHMKCNSCFRLVPKEYVLTVRVNKSGEIFDLESEKPLPKVGISEGIYDITLVRAE